PGRKQKSNTGDREIPGAAERDELNATDQQVAAADKHDEGDDEDRPGGPSRLDCCVSHQSTFQFGAREHALHSLPCRMQLRRSPADVYRSARLWTDKRLCVAQSADGAETATDGGRPG